MEKSFIKKINKFSQVKLFFRHNYKQIPRAVRLFLTRALLLFLAWQVLYQGFLAEKRLLDSPLKQITAYATAIVMDVLYTDDIFSVTHTTPIEGCIGSTCGATSLVMRGKVPLISIADPCNGLSMYALFLGFILAYPSNWILKMSFGTIGMMSLIGVNVCRCVGLAILQIHYPAFTLFAHHYLFNVLTYAAVFTLWYVFTVKAK